MAVDENDAYRGHSKYFPFAARHWIIFLRDGPAGSGRGKAALRNTGMRGKGVMPVIYVAKSRGLEKWGADVGLTKHVYKVGVAEDSAEAAVERLNADAAAGHTDWKLVKIKEVEAADEAQVFARLAKTQRAVDPDYYPGVKGARGIFKVKPTDVERSVLVGQAVAGEEMKPVKVNAAAIADFLIKNALSS